MWKYNISEINKNSSFDVWKDVAVIVVIGRWHPHLCPALFLNIARLSAPSIHVLFLQHPSSRYSQGAASEHDRPHRHRRRVGRHRRKRTNPRYLGLVIPNIYVKAHSAHWAVSGRRWSYKG